MLWSRDMVGFVAFTVLSGVTFAVDGCRDKKKKKKKLATNTGFITEGYFLALLLSSTAHSGARQEWWKGTLGDERSEAVFVQHVIHCVLYKKKKGRHSPSNQKLLFATMLAQKKARFPFHSDK